MSQSAEETVGRVRAVLIKVLTNDDKEDDDKEGDDKKVMIKKMTIKKMTMYTNK